MRSSSSPALLPSTATAAALPVEGGRELAPACHVGLEVPHTLLLLLLLPASAPPMPEGMGGEEPAAKGAPSCEGSTSMEDSLEDRT